MQFSGIFILALVITVALIIVAVKQSESSSSSSNYNKRLGEIFGPTTTNVPTIESTLTSSNPTEVLPKEAPSDPLEDEATILEETFQSKLLKLYNLLKSCQDVATNLDDCDSEG